MNASEMPWRVICLTPVRNEAWILRAFLTAASLWADDIIVADQHSEDDSVAIAREFPKVCLVHNRATTFDEVTRQRLLLERAREIPGPRLLLALDADEFLSPNFFSEPWVGEMTRLGPGSVLHAPLLNVCPGLKRYWRSRGALTMGLLDDGREHTGVRIHNTRVPCHPGAALVNAGDASVLHWQYALWSRMQSKQRWYQCWERVNFPERDAVGLYRQYHHMDAVSASLLRDLPADWLTWYSERGVDLASVTDRPPFWWDREVVRLMAEHGVSRFRRESVWDVDWVDIAARLGEPSPAQYGDPRGPWHRAAQSWLRWTQKHEGALPVRIIDRFLRAVY